MSVQAYQTREQFDALPYTREALVEELALLERHMRDGTAQICGCAFDSHLPLIAGLSSEGIKFAESDEERKYYEDLRDWAHARLDDLATEKGYPAEKLIKESRERRLRVRYKEWDGEMDNPKYKHFPELAKRCTFRIEKHQPKEYFDPKSFRTLCPGCPGARCSECPPELECSTRIVIGCKKGEFVSGKCRTKTEIHNIFHGSPK